MACVRRCAILLIALLIFGNTASAASPDVSLAGDKKSAAAIWATFDRWLHSYSSRDLKGTMEIFDQEVVFAFQGVKDQTYTDLETSYRSDFAAQAGGEWVPEVQEIYADHNTGFARSVWEYRTKAADGTLKVLARNRSIDVFRMGKDGKWRIFRSLNYPEKK